MATNLLCRRWCLSERISSLVLVSDSRKALRNATACSIGPTTAWRFAFRTLVRGTWAVTAAGPSFAALVLAAATVSRDVGSAQAASNLSQCFHWLTPDSVWQLRSWTNQTLWIVS